ncbi:acetyltransferase [Lunatibacter salilacus]|uniref:acetyltransferase n=1 Tax=Lunatibacter salilacus TaxID=2483804 RepID=UPI00131B3087|nr:acetyltransferase [Lunatibacter salilacus]
MPGFRKLILLGYSGHSFVVLDVASSLGYRVIGYLERFEKEKNPHQLEYLGNEKDYQPKDDVTDLFFFPAVGDGPIRKKLVEFLTFRDWRQVHLVDRSATVSDYATLGLSTLVCPKAVVNSFATVGVGCIINSGAVVEHECKLEDFVHVAPGAVLAGDVKVGRNSFIGAGSVIKEGVKIGENIIVGAGSLVLKDICDPGIYIGSPVKKIK